MGIRMVLFDADGVIQEPAADWFNRWAALVGGNADQARKLLSDIFSVETPFLSGGRGFDRAITDVLVKWHCNEPIDEVMKIWTLVRPAEEILELVARVRNGGAQVGLATNQEQHRIDHMRTTLGYVKLFDHFWVSCEIGLVKPSKDYFRQAIQELDLVPREILFIDDNESNVAVAREMGMVAERFHLSEGHQRMQEILHENDVGLA